MCKREMTLGEEIIRLASNGVDISTVERMYKKYMEMIDGKESEEMIEVTQSPKCALTYANVGDAISIRLNGLGDFQATVHEVDDKKIMFIFDDYVITRSMNIVDTNDGGYAESDLHEWLNTKFVDLLPWSVKEKLVKVTIPTVGDMFDEYDEFKKSLFKADLGKQLPLMSLTRNRAAYYRNRSCKGWLMNDTKQEYSTDRFAVVNELGDLTHEVASISCGVRPVLWLTK